LDRRDFIALGSVAAAGAAMLGRITEAEAAPGPAQRVAPGGQVAVMVPNGSTLAWRVAADGVKVGHLVVSELEHEFTPGLSARCWGYNGSTPGPLLEAIEGDRVRIYVTNRLPEATTVHWHGMVVPNGMDGVAGLTQKRIAPGETFLYELTLRYPGTYMYHSHFDEMTQMALGAVGMFIVHPKVPRGPRVDRDFSLMLHEWRINAGARRPDPNEMTDFNVLTFNARVFPGTDPLLVGKGERVRVRLGNLSAMEHHPIHLHGLSFKVTATDGGYVPESAQRPETTVLVPVGATRVIEFTPEEAGDWAMHCHMTHHVMTQMGHGPSMVGVDARAIDARLARVAGTMTMGQNGMGDMGEMNMPIPPNSTPMRSAPGPFAPIEMGGMFTVIKVRERVAGADAKAWYAHPTGSVAEKASSGAMQRDGIDPNRTT
jgi:FtsP/CotA-like multicopper oxidase with cupredoxin domain